MYWNYIAVGFFSKSFLSLFIRILYCKEQIHIKKLLFNLSYFYQIMDNFSVQSFLWLGFMWICCKLVWQLLFKLETWHINCSFVLQHFLQKKKTISATCFLELWKRKQREIQYDWDVAGYELEEVSNIFTTTTTNSINLNIRPSVFVFVFAWA